jgi:precorrin-6A/cobalt-precorrin-6A reductase
MKRVLILGGTAEARELAAAITTRLAGRAEAVTSWAGRTGRTPDVAGEVRVGGFGGTQGLADYIAQERIAAVIDATHPFAELISAHAYDACVIAEVPRLGLVRKPWRLSPGGRWIEVESMAEAAAALARFSRRAFLTTGRQTLDAFSGIDKVWFLVRLIDPPAEPLAFANHEVTAGRPPFSYDHEIELMRRRRIDTLVTKASGGTLPAKIAAAQELKLPIIMVVPPPPPPGARAESVDQALEWIERQL